MKDCPNRGRILDVGKTFCRHPAVQVGGTKSISVPFSICESCPVPDDAKAIPTALVQRSIPLKLTSNGVTVSGTTDGPGSNLIRIFQKFKIPSCSSCYALAAQMDTWGPDECKKRLNQIVFEIMPRAEKWHKKGNWKKTIPKSSLRLSVVACVRLAIWKSKISQSKSEEKK